MKDDLLIPKAAAVRLGISVATFYDWLGKSNYGQLCIRGQAVTIEYYQAGPKGQGRIRIAAAEVDRLLDLMRVRPRHLPPRQRPVQQAFPGITVPLGRPKGV